MMIYQLITMRKKRTSVETKAKRKSMFTATNSLRTIAMASGEQSLIALVESHQRCVSGAAVERLQRIQCHEKS